MHFLQPALIGLDIQSNRIHLAKIKQTRQIELLTTLSIPEHIFTDGKIRQWDVLRAHLLQICQTYRLRGCPVALGIPASLVRMQCIQLPVGMTDTAIEEEIYLHVKRDLPGMSDELSMDFHVEAQADTGYADVYFAASRREYLTQYAACVNDCGFKVRIIDIENYALQRVIYHDLPTSGTHAILYFTNRNATLIVLNGDDILTQHDWEINEFHPHMSRNIDRFLAINRMTIQRLTVCGEEKYMRKMQEESELTWAYSVHYHQALSRMTLAADIDRENMSAYLVACGLAMREVPSW